MAVYRVNKNRGYTVMANYHLRDKTLSLKAVGLLSKMLSFNDGWQFSTKGLSAICKEGPDAVLAALRELEDAGYLVRHQSRDEKGRMSSMVFEIYEKPQTGLPDTEKPHTEKPDTDNPFTGKPCTENPAQLNTNQVITNERNNSLRNYQSTLAHFQLFLRWIVKNPVVDLVGFSTALTEGRLSDRRLHRIQSFC